MEREESSDSARSDNFEAFAIYLHALPRRLAHIRAFITFQKILRSGIWSLMRS